MKQNKLFNNNEGIGGFETGIYDNEAVYPVNTNWTRQSKFSLPHKPVLLWKFTQPNAFINFRLGSFAVDKTGNSIIADCDNNMAGPSTGRIFSVNSIGKKEVLFEINRRLLTPILGAEGQIIISTETNVDSRGNKLICLLPNRKIKWVFNISGGFETNPILDKEGNIYVYTCASSSGSFYSIRYDGSLNWEAKFDRSVPTSNPIISKQGLILLPLTGSFKLHAISKQGNQVWAKEFGGNKWGEGSPVIKSDGTIYICASSSLYALDQSGRIIWMYAPCEGNVLSNPALSHEGKLFVNLSRRRIACLSHEGKELWMTEISGQAIGLPVVDKDGVVYQLSFKTQYPQYVSWVEAFNCEGRKLWKYTIDGTVISAILVDDGLLYVLSNLYTYKKKGWDDKIDVKWELQAIHQAKD